MNDAAAMALAVAEAARGVGRTHPNPSVGAVIVRGEKVVGRGFTSPPGGPHAEINALADAGAKARGATIFCTLEPCDHHGRTGPCSQAIIDAGVKRVVFAMNDPNPLVNGKGERRLKRAGVKVTKGVMSEAAEALNRPFFKFMRTGLPWVTLKAGITLDGKLATRSGKSKWITNETSRGVAHQLRNVVDAIVVGHGTVEWDDPALTTRLPDGGGRNALRVVLDPELRSSAKRQIFDTTHAPTLIVTTKSVDSAQARSFLARGVEVLSLKKFDLRGVLAALAEGGALHVMVEGGAQTHRTFLEADLADELALFVAPTLFGHDGLTWTGALGIDDPKKAPRFGPLTATVLDGDVMLTTLRR
ncbi:MAG: bifunctional diaminohydroxyphosphoribosylaminopyrimidine deaminase/5-amino-6-(5-phosphoribosylamino)uracil reductase RibD [Archangium sp.]